MVVTQKYFPTRKKQDGTWVMVIPLFSNVGRNPLKNSCGPPIFLFVSLLRGCQSLKGTTRSAELLDTKTQTSSGKVQWFYHQLSIEQPLMFSSSSPHMDQNFTVDCSAAFANTLFVSEHFKYLSFFFHV